MKYLLFLSMMLLMFAGCTTYVEVDGRRYAALSESQREYLVIISRQALKKHIKKGLVSPRECDFAMKNEPEFKVDYRGDRYGSAVISWRTPGRLLEFHYEDDLSTRYPICSFAIRPLQPSERGIQPDKSIPGR